MRRNVAGSASSRPYGSRGLTDRAGRRGPVAATILLLGTLSLLAGLLAGPPTSARPDVPTWEVGQRFDVEYRMALYRQGMQPGGGQRVGELRHVVTHEVTELETVELRQRVHVRAVSDRLPSVFDYVFDAELGTLVEVAEELEAGQRLRTSNPFGLAPVLFVKRSFHGLLADFPELDEEAVGSRSVMAPEGAYPEFEQLVQPLPEGGWQVTLQRHDPEAEADYRVLQTWRAGEPWWRSAEAWLGDELLIRGQRLDALPPSRLYLPLLLVGDDAGEPR